MSSFGALLPSGVVTLTTDFGLSDAYVAQLHAVVLRLAPEARIVDISHAVPLGQLETALFLTESAWPHFGGGAIHVVVVDPGVGTARALVAIETEDAFLVGPDSGVLSSGLPGAMRPAEPSLPPTSMPVSIPAALRAVEISASGARAPVVAATFHGRDVMAPVAAALARGTDFASLGEPLTEVVAASVLAASGMRGHVHARRPLRQRDHELPQRGAFQQDSVDRDDGLARRNHDRGHRRELRTGAPGPCRLSGGQRRVTWKSPGPTATRRSGWGCVWGDAVRLIEP